MDSVLPLALGLAIFFVTCLLLSFIAKLILKYLFNQNATTTRIFNVNVLIWLVAEMLSNAIQPVIDEIPVTAFAIFAIMVASNAFATSRKVSTVEGDKIKFGHALATFTLLIIVAYGTLYALTLIFGR